MVTKVKFENKKRNGTTWVNGNAVRFKDGVAVVEDDNTVKDLVKKEGYDILKEDDENIEESNESKKDSKRQKGKK